MLRLFNEICSFGTIWGNYPCFPIEFFRFYDNDFLQASKFVGQEENAPQLVSEIEYFICMSKSGILSLLK